MSNTSEPMTEAMYYILLALYSPNHGYAIMQEIEKISGGRVKMGPGTLYGVLTRLVKNGLIEMVDSDSRRKIYKITPEGEAVLKAEFERLEKMVSDGKGILNDKRQPL